MLMVLEPYICNLVPHFCWNLWESFHFRLSLLGQQWGPLPFLLCDYTRILLPSPILPLCMYTRNCSWYARYIQPSLPFLTRESYIPLLPALWGRFVMVLEVPGSLKMPPFISTAFVKFFFFLFFSFFNAVEMESDTKVFACVNFLGKCQLDSSHN